MGTDGGAGLKVIAGKMKGITLRGGHGPQFRPTAQIVKGSVLDTLYGEIQGAVILDLFAGSGSLGIEALSRGAKRSVFVEQDKNILRALQGNIEKCGLSREEVRIHRGDAIKFLEKTIKTGSVYDIIFADPPYSSKLAGRVASMLSKAGREICRYLIIESGEEIQIEDNGKLEKLRVRKFGQTLVTYFRYRE
ncbi:MAG: 16S rRNA (guanine(966)-N(2))-methyltransferase RsmD [Candidatus Krumholzibacteriota bacterium]|nr:16S rRNA (guanine(966)-N(2))-methyltransferase RsmD [Candidatus Krumholzibacteriota bacterium]